MTAPWVCRSCRTAQIARVLRQTRRQLSSNSRYFQISEEVRQAISERRPVVALETTIYTHGFPYPDNMALASRLESLVRIHGGVPATIGILDGVAHVGMGADQLMRLVSCAGQPNLRKVSRRDFGFVLGMSTSDGKPINGGTTVAGTSVLAHMAGIRIFATGGLGGVHRGAEQTMDISADLTELGRTPVAVISSGCKSFLDLAKTLEYLETQGVAVATFADGRDGPVDFPAFYSRDSGIRSPAVVRDELEAAKVLHAHYSLGLQSGLHFASPIPEKHSIPHAKMEQSIAIALAEADRDGVNGAAATPYILDKIKELTANESVEANRALAENNVIRGTKVAVELQRLEREELSRSDKLPDYGSLMAGPRTTNYTATGSSKDVSLPRGRSAAVEDTTQMRSLPAGSALPASNTAELSAKKPTVFVAGSLNVDLACDFLPQAGSSHHSPEHKTSNPAAIVQSLGGVGHNVARAAQLMGADVQLCSAVGDDLSGKAALEALSANGMCVEGITILPANSGNRTGQYVAINDRNKDLVMAMADVSVLEQTSDDSAISQALENTLLPQLRDARPTHLAVDANWPPKHLARWLDVARAIDAHVSFEPVGNAKSTRLFQLPKSHVLSVFPRPSVHLITPNRYELAAMHQAARDSGALDRQDWWEIIDALGIPSSGARTQMALATSGALVDQGIPQQSIQLLPFVPSICTKLGSEGVLLTQLLAANDPRLASGEYAPHILSRCANGTEETTGVGGVYMRLFPALEKLQPDEVVSVNGVGDTFAGTLLAGLAQRGKDARVENMIDLAQRAAVLTLKSKESVSPGLGTLRILL